MTKYFQGFQFDQVNSPLLWHLFKSGFQVSTSGIALDLQLLDVSKTAATVEQNSEIFKLPVKSCPVGPHFHPLSHPLIPYLVFVRKVSGQGVQQGVQQGSKLGKPRMGSTN
jgi:hypothetical protein